MIRNELYKIIVKKSFILFLIFFCGMNVFYVGYEAATSDDSSALNAQIYGKIGGMDKEERNQYLLAKIEEFSKDKQLKGIYDKYCDVLNYSRGISDFQKNISQITDVQASTFDNLLYSDGSFASRNKRNIEKEYASKNIAEIKPVFGNYEGISKGVQSGVHDIFLLIILLMITMNLVMQEKQDSLTMLQRPTIHGRGRLYLAKFLSASLVTLVVTLIVQGINLCIYIYYYGCDSFFVPIQSVNNFRQSTLRVDIFQYIFIYLGLKITASIVFLSGLLLLCAVCRNVVQVYIFTILLTSVEGAFYLLIGEHDFFCGLKFFNAFSISNVYSITRMYFNINMNGIPLNILKSIVIFELAMLILLFTVGYFIFRNNTSIAYKRIKNHMGVARGHHSSVLYHEFYKIFIKNKFAVPCIILIIIQIYSYHNVVFYKDSVDQFVIKYITEIDGTYDKEAENLLDSEQQRFDKMDADFEKANQDFAEGKITNQMMLDIMAEYDIHNSEKMAFEEILEKRDYLLKLKENKGIEGYFVFDNGYLEALYYGDQTREILDGMLQILILIIGMIPIFVMDRESGMNNVILPTKKGRKNTCMCRTLIGTLAGMVISLFTYLPRYSFTLREYGISHFDAPIQSISQYYNFPVEISIRQFMIITIIAQMIISEIFILLLLGISMVCSNLIQGLISVSAVIMIPLTTLYMGNNALENILFVPAVTVNNSLRNGSIITIINICVFACVSIGIYIYGYKKYCKKGRKVV